MAIDVRPGLILAIVLGVASIPFVIDLSESWSLLQGVPKEVIAFVDILIWVGIGMLVEWFFSRIFPDDGGSGGM